MRDSLLHACEMAKDSAQLDLQDQAWKPVFQGQATCFCISSKWLNKFL